MTIAEKIKFIRTFRNIPQKHLGLALGFADNTLESRISQYERGLRVPKDEVIVQMSIHMSVSKLALIDNVENKIANIIMQMFWIEVEIHQYTQKSNIPNSANAGLIYNQFMLDMVNDKVRNRIAEEDLLTKAIMELQQYRQLVFTGVITYDDYIEIMLNWESNSDVAKSIYNT